MVSNRSTHDCGSCVWFACRLHFVCTQMRPSPRPPPRSASSAFQNLSTGLSLTHTLRHNKIAHSHLVHNTPLCPCLLSLSAGCSLGIAIERPLHCKIPGFWQNHAAYIKAHLLFLYCPQLQRIGLLHSSVPVSCGPFLSPSSLTSGASFPSLPSPAWDREHCAAPLHHLLLPGN